MRNGFRIGPVHSKNSLLCCLSGLYKRTNKLQCSVLWRHLVTSEHDAEGRRNIRPYFRLAQRCSIQYPCNVKCSKNLATCFERLARETEHPARMNDQCDLSSRLRPIGSPPQKRQIWICIWQIERTGLVPQPSPDRVACICDPTLLGGGIMTGPWRVSDHNIKLARVVIRYGLEAAVGLAAQT